MPDPVLRAAVPFHLQHAGRRVASGFERFKAPAKIHAVRTTSDHAVPTPDGSTQRGRIHQRRVQLRYADKRRRSATARDLRARPHQADVLQQHPAADSDHHHHHGDDRLHRVHGGLLQIPPTWSRAEGYDGRYEPTERGRPTGPLLRDHPQGGAAGRR
uniref:(northern house mosquito) hypothetical protein n=1 Tax=Culex pipiens TaxID=7175 RepID=A0A8D8J4P4_CULPI